MVCTVQIIFVEDHELAKVLAKEIPLCLLPKELGGAAELPSAWEKYGRAEIAKALHCCTLQHSKDTILYRTSTAVDRSALWCCQGTGWSSRAP